MAGLNPQTIGTTMPHGMAGSYARQPDMIVNTKPLGGNDNVPFGLALVYDENKKVVLPKTGATAAQFIGVAAREIKSSLNYLEQGVGQYAPNDAVSVFQRGSVNVKCQNGTAAVGADVYMRIKVNDSFPNAVVGGFEAVADSENSVKLTNAQWAGAADANGIAELRILTMLNA